MKYAWVAGLIVFSGTALAAAPFSFDELHALIEANHVTTVDQLVPLLPPYMKRNAMLVYKSHALHADRVTPAAPRAILFNEDASLIIAFTGNPGAAAIASGNDPLEVIRFDPTSHRFEMRDLVMDGVSSPFTAQLRT